MIKTALVHLPRADPRHADGDPAGDHHLLAVQAGRARPRRTASSAGSSSSRPPPIRSATAPTTRRRRWGSSPSCCSRRGCSAGDVPRAVLGGDHLPGGDGPRHADGRLADRPHDGLEDHPPDPASGLLRGDGRRHHAVRRDRLGIPVSTTHTITGAIMGVGAARRASAVRWGVAGNIVIAWFLTIPASAAGRRALLRADR